MRQETFLLEGIEIKAETDKAILVEQEDGTEIWLPLSQVEEIHRAKTRLGSSVRMSRWIASQKGLL